MWLQQAWVLNDRSLNQLKGGFSNFRWALTTDPKWQGGSFPLDKGMGGTAPTILFTGYSIGTQPSNAPQDIFERIWSVRDDFTMSYTALGRHDLKTGGEYLHWFGNWLHWCNRCAGVYSTNSRPPANVESLFPVWNDVSTWNLAPLSPLITRYEESFGDHSMTRRRDVFAVWRAPHTVGRLVTTRRAPGGGASWARASSSTRAAGRSCRTACTSSRPPATSATRLSSTCTS